MNRYQAALTHFTVCIVITVCLLCTVFFIWYPGAIANAAGVTGIFLILLGVDLCLGPLLTLVIFNPHKKPWRELRRDLAIIATVQIAALAYGVHTVFVARPVYMVFNADRFDLVFANDMTYENLAKVTRDEFKTLPLLGPRWIGAHPPSDIKERNQLMFSTINGGEDLPQLPQYYLPYTQLQNQALKRAQPIAQLTQFNPTHKTEIEKLRQRYPDTQYAYLPLKGKTQDLTVIIARSDAHIVSVENLKPWM